jgi:hypothetical protein
MCLNRREGFWEAMRVNTSGVKVRDMVTYLADAASYGGIFEGKKGRMVVLET